MCGCWWPILGGVAFAVACARFPEELGQLASAGVRIARGQVTHFLVRRTGPIIDANVQKHSALRERRACRLPRAAARIFGARRVGSTGPPLRRAVTQVGEERIESFYLAADGV